MCALVTVLALVLICVALHKRVGVIVGSVNGKLQVVHGCSAFSRGIFRDEDGFEREAKRIFEVQRDGSIAMFDTSIGSIWYPVSAWTWPALVEASAADLYNLRSLVRLSDVVLDVGANMGTETRNALSAGARLVVAIEPDPVSLECLRRNLSSEIRENRVIVVPQGAWDKAETMPLYLDAANAGGASVLFANGRGETFASLNTIDWMVSNLKLPKVDVIKIHVEGAERQALLGARETIRRFHPRLALSLEHYLSDADTLPQTARAIWPGYHVQLTPCVKTFARIHPEVALLTSK